MGFSCPSYPLAQELPPPLIPQCFLQRACSSSSILGCSEEGCHTNQSLAFCRQREHRWYSNQPKQLLHCFSGTGGGHCSGIEASHQEPSGVLPHSTFLPWPVELTLQNVDIGSSLSLPLPKNWWGCFPALGVFSHPNIRGHQLTRKQLLGVSFGRGI